MLAQHLILAGSKVAYRGLRAAATTEATTTSAARCTAASAPATIETSATASTAAEAAATAATAATADHAQQACGDYEERAASNTIGRYTPSVILHPDVEEKLTKR